MSSFRLTRLATLSAFIFAAGAQATELPRQLSVDNVKHATRVLGFGSSHRAWTAPSLPNPGFGLEMGLEASVIPRRDIDVGGSGGGVVPSLIPVPRLWAAWDLPADFQVSASYAPGNFFDGVTAIGIGTQWTYHRAEDIQTSLSAVITYTYASSFEDLATHTTGVAAQVSRDLQMWQPYAGLGFMVSNGTAEAEVIAAGASRGPHTVAASHFYLGAQVELAARLSFQMDLIGNKLGFALMIANRF